MLEQLGRVVADAGLRQIQLRELRARRRMQAGVADLNGTKLQLFDSRKELVRTFGAVKGKIGEVLEPVEGRLVITAQGGRIHAGKAKLGDGKKVTAGDLVSSGQIKPGTLLGS